MFNFKYYDWYTHVRTVPYDNKKNSAVNTKPDAIFLLPQLLSCLGFLFTFRSNVIVASMSGSSVSMDFIDQFNLLWIEYISKKKQSKNVRLEVCGTNNFPRYCKSCIFIWGNIKLYCSYDWLRDKGAYDYIYLSIFYIHKNECVSVCTL